MLGSLLWSVHARSRTRSSITLVFTISRTFTLTRVSAPISWSACGSSASRLKWPWRNELVIPVSSSVSILDGLSTMYLEIFPRMRLPISPSALGEISIMWPSSAKRVMNWSLSNWSYWVSYKVNGIKELRCLSFSGDYIDQFLQAPILFIWMKCA